MFRHNKSTYTNQQINDRSKYARTIIHTKSKKKIKNHVVSTVNRKTKMWCPASWIKYTYSESIKHGQLVEREEKRQHEEYVGDVAGRRGGSSCRLAVAGPRPPVAAQLLLHAAELFRLYALRRGDLLRRGTAAGHRSSRGGPYRSPGQHGPERRCCGRRRLSRFALVRLVSATLRSRRGRGRGGGGVVRRHRVGRRSRTVYRL